MGVFFYLKGNKLIITIRDKLCAENRNSIMICPDGIDDSKVIGLLQDTSTQNFIDYCQEYKMNCARTSFDVCFEKSKKKMKSE